MRKSRIKAYIWLLLPKDSFIMGLFLAKIIKKQQSAKCGLHKSQHYFTLNINIVG